MLKQAERPLIVAGGGIINADASDLLVEFAELTGVPVIPTLMGWGTIPDDHPLMAGMCGLQTSHRYGNATMLASRLRAGHRQPLGQPPHRLGRGLHEGPQVRARGHRAHPDRPRVRARTSASSPTPKLALELFVAGRARTARQPAGCATAPPGSRSARSASARCCARPTSTTCPMKPQRVYQCMNRAFDDRHLLRQHHRPVADRGAQFLHVYKPRHWINCGQAGPLGWTVPAALGVRAADPTRKIVALSGDYDFQFMIEELAVGAQFKLPYIHMVVNNCLPGPDPPGAARLRHGLLRAARLRQHQHAGRRPARARLRRRPRQGGRRPGLQGHPRAQAGRARPAIAQAEALDGGVPGAGGDRGDPGARDQHLDGHRDRQDQRVRGSRRLAPPMRPRAVAAMLD